MMSPRTLAVSLASWLLRPLQEPSLLSKAPPPPTRIIASIDDAVSLIQTTCPRDFVDAVTDTHRFLYRGETLSANTVAAVLTPAPDLLDASTYEDRNALLYFQRLEHQLALHSILARPSTGHIGTATLAHALVWAPTAVSVWPLLMRGEQQWSYVYPKTRQLFYPDHLDAEDILDHVDVVLDRHLDVALRQGQEILFATGPASTAFLAVSADYDDELWQRLLITHPLIMTHR